MTTPRLINLPHVADQSGTLTSIEAGKDIPFDILRVFYMHHIHQERGGHAHLDTDQIVVAAAGSFEMHLLTTKCEKLCFKLNDPNTGLYVPRMVFIDIKNISTDAVCMVLANTHYDMKKSLRTLADFEKHISE